MTKDVALGKLLREKRLAYGWSVETVGIIYGNWVRGKPVTGGAIHTMEEGKLPHNQTRRWVLARMFNIAPVAFGLATPKAITTKTLYPSFRKAKAVDTQEYFTTLLSYWKSGYSGTAEDALKDLGMRIHALHENILYVDSAQKELMKRLLCGFHMRRSIVAHELSYKAQAFDHLNKAVILAREEGFTDLEATALYRRGEYAFDNWNFKMALNNLRAAQSLDRSTERSKNTIPPYVKGRILNVRGLTEAHLAASEKDISKALKFIDASEAFSANLVEDNVHMLNLSRKKYFINRAIALTASSSKKLRRSDEAYELSEEISKGAQNQPKRFQSYDLIENKFIEIHYYMDKAYYPVATTLTQNVLATMQADKSAIYLPSVTRVYEELLESSYGKSVEVAELGLHLLFIQFPHLFN